MDDQSDLRSKVTCLRVFRVISSYVLLLFYFSDFCPIDWSWILVKATSHAISKMIFNTKKCSTLSVVSLSE